ncbi:MAG TPA: class F sortase [Candidatus Saccharimonadales bacterium]|nr:class F sortase [Candidatus Saccharimonadales bacterium]
MTLSSPALAGRLRTDNTRRSTYERRAVGLVRPRTLQDVRRAPATSVPNHVAKLATPRPAQTHAPFPRTKAPAMKARTARSEVLRRDLVAQPAAARKRRRKGGLQTKLLTVAAVGLCLLAVGVGLSGLHTNHTVEAQVSHITKQVDQAAASGAPAPADVPSENKPANTLANYRVAADLPREIKIAKLGVDARVVRLGVLANNALATPSNIFDTGWYDGSAKPGEASAMLIDGHVSGPTQNGVFYGIKNLVKGDKITVQRGDGQVFTYDVTGSKVYDAGDVDMAAALTPAVAGKAGLNLITCTGKLDSSKTHFQQRVLVFAAQE